MTYNIITKKLNLADSSKEKILDKVTRLDKFFNDDSTECKIIVSELKDDIIVEITFRYKGFIIRAEDTNRDLLTAVDNCLAAIDRQIRKNKTKLSKRLRDSGFDKYESIDTQPRHVEEETEFKIIKKKIFSAKPMMVEEAILQMNMLGHSFFIFNDPDTMSPNIVYKRKDGNYALIELGE
ncbi:MAG TPA: ribosome-associated translation inhibitor RaiA [Candidatus Monoglobus merdigallinarum]|uniref:Ribosome hibernation promoting factor n=1 Tax=Candidatus Monoglobus merdigallinarum TaxID=2838698 RepID=A0A9D1TLL0_9FIRM|nr:ribosome-associated translation inhibitor RaiA [Candidatus Monoglobus merdigallinarum]